MAIAAAAREPYEDAPDAPVRGSYYSAYPIPEPPIAFIALLARAGDTVTYRRWPEETQHLFRPREHTPIAVPAKLRPLLVVSTAEEIAATGDALVLPTSQWVPADYGPEQAAAISGNGTPHLHWIAASRRFGEISACTVDFRWSYRLPRELLALGRRRAPDGHPRGPIARLRGEEMAELLARFRAYLT